MNSLLFPDVNVWVALNHQQHLHHAAAKRWYEALPDSATLVFCRQTQLGFFRVLTTFAVMGHETVTQHACWQIFDRWVATGQVAWADEPQNLEIALRKLTTGAGPSPEGWMDAYLTAFVKGAGLTLITFDRALAAKVKRAVLLQ
jgi:hypothetical protein